MKEKDKKRIKKSNQSLKKNATCYVLRATCLKGFSFIEVMLSVFLISVGIAATLSLLTLGIRKSTENRRQLIATMLSQEGIELVRNIRDTNAKSGTVDSFDGLSANSYTMDYKDAALQSDSGNNKYLQYSNGFYESGGSAGSSQFSRIIKITTPLADQRTIYSTVTWGSASIPSSPSESNCNLATKCIFTTITLNKWRE